MSINKEELLKFEELVSLYLRRRQIIVLDPEENVEDLEKLNNNIILDASNWNMPKDIREKVEELSKNNRLSPEDKLFAIYEIISTRFVYDDNLISYIQRDKENKNPEQNAFIVPDEYGRDVDEEWEQNREEHNRRVCYELARYLAKALKELYKDMEDYNVCIFWDKSLTHYYVGLTCREYSVTLDPDDFNNIKDLTRLKTGLTAEGITILEDKYGRFKSSLDKFNEGRDKYAVRKIEAKIEDTKNDDEEQDEPYESQEPDEVKFLRNAVEILTSEYEIDSQGLFEYMKEIVDTRLGPDSRKKVCKVIKGATEK